MNNDDLSKSLMKSGTVFTPEHIAGLFCELADLKYDDVLFEPCLGTGALLRAGVNRLISMPENEGKDITSQIHAVEKDKNMYDEAIKSELLRDNSNVLYGDFFDVDTSDIKERVKPTVGFINPPYSLGSKANPNLYELNFVERLLDCLISEGKVIAIIPMSCAIGTKKEVSDIKKRILEKHTLDAVMSMPGNLFYPVGVCTCIMIFTAHKKHCVSEKSWFGYWKDDGFVIRKNKGRIDGGSWGKIKDKWVSAYRCRSEKAGFSVLKDVTGTDEWLAEAYMETDYSKLTQRDFEKTVADYLIYQFKTTLYKNMTPAAKSVDDKSDENESNTTTTKKEPDWAYMENYIKSLPFGSMM